MHVQQRHMRDRRNYLLPNRPPQTDTHTAAPAFLSPVPESTALMCSRIFTLLPHFPPAFLCQTQSSRRRSTLRRRSYMHGRYVYICISLSLCLSVCLSVYVLVLFTQTHTAFTPTTRPGGPTCCSASASAGILVWGSTSRTRCSMLPTDLPTYTPAQHSTAQHSTAQHSTAQHSTAQHSTAQHN